LLRFAAFCSELLLVASCIWQEFGNNFSDDRHVQRR
jgi:hypothetical protein